LPDVALLEIGKHLNFPYFSQILNLQIWIIAMTIALIASLETLLGIEAVDAIDNLKRKTPVNRELIAQGIGNMCSGFIGGIPITSVIVRSSANINAGAVSKLSTILHGVFLLLSLLVFSNYLNYIPLAALAAILITTGYKLAKVSLFKEMWEKGYGQFLPFLATIVGIVLTDLLKGVFIGLAVSLFFVLRSSFKSPFSLRSEVRYVGEVIKLKLPSQVSFFNKNALQKFLEQQPINSQLEIDGSDTFFLDHDTSELIKSFRDVFAINKNIKLNIVGFKGRYQNLNQQNIRTSLDAQTRSLLAPEQIVHLLQEGNKRFVEGTSSEAKKNYKTQADELVAGQSPMAVVLGCMDSRAIPEVLFDTAIGDILTIRVAGNIIGPSELSSLEIAVKKLGAKVILIKGHSNCGAVSLAIANITDDNIAFTTEKIRRSVEQCGLHFNEAITSSNVNDNPLMMQAVINQNTKNSIMDIIYSSSYLNNQIVQGNVKIIGAYHDIATGLVHFDSEDLV
jgi:carbonic anhydrase